MWTTVSLNYNLLCGRPVSWFLHKSAVRSSSKFKEKFGEIKNFVTHFTLEDTV